MRYFNVKADEISKEFYSFNEMMERLDSEGLIGPYKEAVKKDERNYDKECNPIRQIPWDDKEGVRVSPIPAKEWGLFQEQRARIRGNFDEFVRNAIRIYQTVFQKGDCAIYVSPSGEMFKIDASDLKGVRMQDARLTPTVGDLFKYTK